jgi:hypothetical protein
MFLSTVASKIQFQQPFSNFSTEFQEKNLKWLGSEEQKSTHPLLSRPVRLWSQVS